MVKWSKLRWIKQNTQGGCGIILSFLWPKKQYPDEYIYQINIDSSSGFFVSFYFLRHYLFVLLWTFV